MRLLALVVIVLRLIACCRSDDIPAVPVFVEEEHDQVLARWYRHWHQHKHAAVGKLRQRNNILIHVDTHPDMKANSDSPHHDPLPSSIPDETPPEYGIASFILPAVYAGLLDRVIFVRAPWAHQYREAPPKKCIDSSLTRLPFDRTARRASVLEKKKKLPQMKPSMGSTSTQLITGAMGSTGNEQVWSIRSRRSSWSPPSKTPQIEFVAE